MASGRIIHKTIHTNEQLAELELGARYLYVGTIIQSDDEGRMKASPKYLKALIFPFDEVIRISSIKAWRDSLSATGLIQLYAAGGQEYLAHPNWEKWQPLRSDRVKPSDCPPPSSGCQLVDNSPPNLTQPNLTQPNQIMSFDFEAIWTKYPNKDGKASALRSFRSSVKTEKDWLDINQAVDNYLKSEKVLKGFIKNGSTWFNNWRDWVDFVDPKAKLSEQDKILAKFGMKGN